MAKPLMPKATAVWLVDNTALTFEQIADYCGLHSLEVKGIADGDVAQGIKGLDPVANGQVTREELEKAEADPEYRMKVATARVNIPEPKRKGPRYTPVSRRQDRPDAIFWLLRHHSELSDPQISKLIGTTKPTITSVRERTHWNAANLKPVDPVTLGLCSQLELDAAVQIAAEKRAKDPSYQAAVQEGEDALRPIEETLGTEDVFGTGDVPGATLTEEQAPTFQTGFENEANPDGPRGDNAEVDHDPLRRQVFGD